MDDAVLAIYCLCDDLLKALLHHEDRQRQMSDAEGMTTAIVAALYFGGNFERARLLLARPRYIPAMVSKSQFNRRLHLACGARFVADDLQSIGRNLQAIESLVALYH